MKLFAHPSDRNPKPRLTPKQYLAAMEECAVRWEREYRNPEMGLFVRTKAKRDVKVSAS